MSAIYKNMDESHNTEGKKPGKTVRGIFYKTQKKAEGISMSGVGIAAISEVEVG